VGGAAGSGALSGACIRASTRAFPAGCAG
jgi:hypothetical protein